MQEVAICSVLLKPWSSETTADPVLHGVFNVIDSDQISDLIQNSLKEYFADLKLNYIGFSTIDVGHPAGTYFTVESTKLGCYDVMYTTAGSSWWATTMTSSLGKIYVIRNFNTNNILSGLKLASATYTEQLTKFEQTARALVSRLSENDTANIKLRELLADTIRHSDEKSKRLDYYQFAIDEANDTIERLRLELSLEKDKHSASVSLPMIKRSPAIILQKTHSSPEIKQNSLEKFQSVPKNNLILELCSFDKSKLRKSGIGC